MNQQPSWGAQSVVARRLLIAGLIATTVGSFLPWSFAGDWARWPEAGVRILPMYLYSEHARWLVPQVDDHGGLLVLVVSFALGTLLVVRRDRADQSRLWAVAGSSALLLLSLFHVAELIVSSVKWGNSPGAPSVGIGLMLITLGSVLAVVAAPRLQPADDPS